MPVGCFAKINLLTYWLKKNFKKVEFEMFLEDFKLMTLGSSVTFEGCGTVFFVRIRDNGFVLTSKNSLIRLNNDREPYLP